MKKQYINFGAVSRFLDYMVDKDTTIEDFIKTTNEGRKLIPESGNVANVRLEELNEALEKEGLKKIEFVDSKGIKYKDKTPFHAIDDYNTREKSNYYQINKQSSNEEEM